ncbi:hypothetical protein SARC_03714 [Sphaeroforma arctica JP610]|uniref:Uncharacterized protein n=1 Tax=Sphaeroforma arctica JP610 TaxID=667725 RepID=A0A0L0G4Q4_9EUKA|nr:hypothetical protein SARC_03714 [Sphaeroforma arctica JP610]KNC84052.1 hypothetical protein SARC_03714 [Sphaeroforma arctica JP610]|eukprot:XP_014157954.1 hypothetical protein SARC_03714 [Sphaeroforma arctica JP610]
MEGLDRIHLVARRGDCMMSGDIKDSFYALQVEFARLAVLRLHWEAMVLSSPTNGSILQPVVLQSAHASTATIMLGSLDPQDQWELTTDSCLNEFGTVLHHLATEKT